MPKDQEATWKWVVGTLLAIILPTTGWILKGMASDTKDLKVRVRNLEAGGAVIRETLKNIEAQLRDIKVLIKEKRDG